MATACAATDPAGYPATAAAPTGDETARGARATTRLVAPLRRLDGLVVVGGGGIEVGHHEWARTAPGTGTIGTDGPACAEVRRQGAQHSGFLATL